MSRRPPLLLRSPARSGDTSAPIPRWRHVALAVCMFLITGVFGFLQPFVPLYLEASGLSKGQIGLVTGLGAGLALLIQPLLGRLSDRLDARRPLMVAAAVVSCIAYLSYRAAEGLLAFIGLTALGVNGFLYLNAAGAVLAGRLLGSASGRGAGYVRYRIWGSVGYIVVALLAGVLVNRGLSGAGSLGRGDLAAVFTFGPLLFLAIALAALFVPDRRAPALPDPAGASRHAHRAVAADSNLRGFLIAFFLYQFALYGATAYLPLFMRSLGARPPWITGMFAAGVICEVLVMARVGHLSDAYGRRPVLAVTFLLMPLRLLLYIPATGPLWVLLVQTLHGINFGIMGTIAVVFVNDLATDRNRSAAQARLAAASGLGLALGPVVCGGIAQQAGIGWMFAWMALVGAAGAAVFVARVRESHPSPAPFAHRGPVFLHPLWRLLAGR